MPKTLAAALLALGLAGPLSPPTCGPPAGDPAPPAGPAVSATPTVTIRGANAVDRAALADALARFASAGLLLPDLEVLFGHDTSRCDGHMGEFEKHRTPWRISVCSELEFVIPHEIAHAWAAANLDDAERSRYTAARGFTNWSDHTRPWAERACEDAAFIMQQNLRDVGRVPPTSATWIERMEAYELLTGLRSPLRP